jgi:hypothetical protein
MDNMASPTAPVAPTIAIFGSLLICLSLTCYYTKFKGRKE